jgi:GNAT superfamily N-acetyltransferase
MTDAAAAPVRARTADAAFAATVAFRLATHDDVAALVPMINDAYMREAWLLPPPRTDVPSLHEDLDRPGASIIIAEIDAALAGSIALHNGQRDAYFGMLAVSTPHQGRGLAAMLIAEAERHASEAGRTAMRCDCARELGLAPVYQSLGYTIEAEVPGQYYGRNGVRKGPITRIDLVKVLQ